LRAAFKEMESLGPAVVWIDEIEKAITNSTSSAGDSGVAADALGAVLSWMQERRSEAFLVVTANDISGLPPELLRKGRFDELWFLDLPNATERAAILRATLAAYRRAELDIDVSAVAKATEGFVGAEIAALVPDAMFAAFADGMREITTADLIEAARRTVPLAVTAKDKIEKLRAWGSTSARPASAPEVIDGPAPAKRRGRLDI
jgi:SpoVK/Ycf46/Vps4 family AAA+-type ATPase